MNNLLVSMVVALPLAVASQLSFAGGDAANGEKLSATCAACHGADGNSTSGVNPKLAGQYESYLIHALKEYRSGARANATMAGMAAGLSDQDIRDLAAWFASQESTLQVLDM